MRPALHPMFAVGLLVCYSTQLGQTAIQHLDTFRWVEGQRDRRGEGPRGYSRIYASKKLVLEPGLNAVALGERIAKALRQVEGIIT